MPCNTQVRLRHREARLLAKSHFTSEECPSVESMKSLDHHLRSCLARQLQATRDDLQILMGQAIVEAARLFRFCSADALLQPILHFFLQDASATSFKGCLRHLKLDRKPLVSPSRVFGVTPCYSGPLETGVFFPAEGGYVTLGTVWIVFPLTSRKTLASPGRIPTRGCLCKAGMITLSLLL